MDWGRGRPTTSICGGAERVFDKAIRTAAMSRRAGAPASQKLPENRPRSPNRSNDQAQCGEYDKKWALSTFRERYRLSDIRFPLIFTGSEFYLIDRCQPVARKKNPCKFRYV